MEDQERQEKKGLVSSSMIELKAELFRKQEEFKQQKAATSGFVKGKKGEKVTKKSLWHNSNAGVAARAEKDLAETEKEEDENIMEKSRKMLERKSKLYEKLTSSKDIPEEDGSDYYLVDFQKKAIDAIVEERETARQKEEEDEAEAEKNAPPVEISSGEEWVDFTDSLGRDRRCMKKDLDQLMKKDRELAMAKSSKKTKDKIEMEKDEANSDSDGLPHLMSADMHREMMRQKWEDESKALLDKDQDEIHYSNVQFDEIRSHGVGFFQFSKDHEQREEQLDKLKKMREETLDERSRKDQIKDKRKMIMEARLAKVRQRRKLKDGGINKGNKPDDEEVEVGPKLDEVSISLSKNIEQLRKEESERQAEEKRKSHIREWDKDKTNDSKNEKRHINPNKNYVETRREERDVDFAPPAMYFDQPRVSAQQTSKKNYTKQQPPLFKTSTVISNTKLTPNAGPLTEDQNKFPPDLDSGKATENRGLTEGFHDWNSSSMSQTIESIPLPAEPQAAVPSVSSTDSGLNTSGFVGNNWSGNDPQFEHYNNTSTYNQQSVGHYGLQPDSYLTHQQQYNTHQNYLMQPPQQGIYGYNQQQCTSDYSCSLNPNPQYNPTSVSNQHPPSSNSLQPVPNSAEMSQPVQGVHNSFQHLAAPVIQDNAASVEPKRPKIPKMAIIDTRFVKNDDSTAESVVDSLASHVEGVVYTPGSYTAAKQMSAEQYEEHVADLRIKNQISGGPCLYTKEEVERQQQEFNEEESDGESSEDKKVQEFLSSLKSGM